MNKKTYIIIAVVAVVVVAGIIFFVSSNSGTPSYQAPPATPPTASPATPPAAQNPSAPSPAQSTQYVVSYTDSGFSPTTLIVPKSATVIFKNSASDDMRVASNPHPVHSGYPTIGGCVSSTFDSCNNISPGTSWSFKFDVVGTWGFHNHLNPSEGGTIVVQ